MSVLHRLIAASVICAVSLTLPYAAIAQSSKPAPSSAPRTTFKAEALEKARKKIAFNLDEIDADGLRGPADGKVTVSYEFAIPDTKRNRAEVKRLDPTVHFLAGSSGHIGAKKGQCLCIGDTHQKNWRATLERLAALPYIERIIQAWFE